MQNNKKKINDAIIIIRYLKKLSSFISKGHKR